MKLRWLTAVAVTAVAAFAAAGCGGTGSKDGITVYSGREEEIVAPLFQKFTAKTGIKVDVRYGQSAELAAQIAEEGKNSPADVFFAQDAGALGSVAGQLAPLPDAVLQRVGADYRDPKGTWVGTSGRVRVVAYNTKKYTAAQLPNEILAYADPKYRGRIGIAPTNASFQAFVTAMRLGIGDDRTRAFLRALKANGAKLYPRNLAIMEAIAAGEIDLGLVNHYYLALLKEEQPDAPVDNKFLTPGDPGAFVNVAGVGVLATSKRRDAANTFVEYLLSDEGQRFYANEAEENEYPLVAGIPARTGLPPLASLKAKAVPLADLGAAERATLEMLSEVGLTS